MMYAPLVRSLGGKGRSSLEKPPWWLLCEAEEEEADEEPLLFLLLPPRLKYATENTFMMASDSCC
jgi:hypothetical protein